VIVIANRFFGAWSITIRLADHQVVLRNAFYGIDPPGPLVAQLRLCSVIGWSLRLDFEPRPARRYRDTYIPGGGIKDTTLLSCKNIRLRGSRLSIPLISLGTTPVSLVTHYEPRLSPG